MHANVSLKCFNLIAVLSAALVAISVGVAAAATEWNEKTILKFSEPVMVPGATLPPGSYVFKLKGTSQRHTVQITTEDGSKVMALTHAVPTKRADARGDIVLKFNP